MIHGSVKPPASKCGRFYDIIFFVFFLKVKNIHFVYMDANWYM